MLKSCKECSKEVSEDAKKCPHCGKDLRNWFMRHKVITFIGCFIIIAIIGNVAGGNQKASTSIATQSQQAQKLQEEQNKTQEEIIAISSEDLAKAFKDNEIKANNQYRDKIAKITGKVKDIGEALGYTYIILSSGKDFEITDIQCFFDDKNEISKIANLNKGDIVSVEGQIEGKSLNVSVKKCTIVSKWKN